MSQSQTRKKIVTIGGGTGSFTLLSGLVEHDIDISAIVSMADDGGSTGILRDELGVLPPGDIRQCLVALSPAGNELRKLLNYRFDNGGLGGHAFGNIFLSALEKETGDFLSGVEAASRILGIRGEVLPVTGDDARLVMKLSDGTRIHGEVAIEKARIQKIGVEKLFFDPPVRVNRMAAARIREADAVVIGPGTLYSGILSTLIFPEIAKAIQETRAKVILPINLTNKKDHTGYFSAEDYLDVFERYIGKERIDIVLVNMKNPDEKLLERYRDQEGEDALVTVNGTTDLLKERYPKTEFILTDLLDGKENHPDTNDAVSHARSFIRHDPEKLARAILRSF